MGDPNDGALDQAADPGSGSFTVLLGCPVAQADSTDDAFLKKLQSRGVVILDEDGAEQAIGVAQEPADGAGRPSSSWRVEPPSPPATWTIEEYTIRDLVSVRPYRGSVEPVGVAHPVTLHIEPLAAQARPVRSRGHRVKHDSRMLDRPPPPVGAVNALILPAQFFALIPQPPGNAYTGRADLPRNPRRHLLGPKQRIEIRAPR